jgi:hypothetical protein
MVFIADLLRQSQPGIGGNGSVAKAMTAASPPPLSGLLSGVLLKEPPAAGSRGDLPTRS